MNTVFKYSPTVPDQRSVKRRPTVRWSASRTPPRVSHPASRTVRSVSAGGWTSRCGHRVAGHRRPGSVRDNMVSNRVTPHQCHRAVSIATYTAGTICGPAAQRLTGLRWHRWPGWTTGSSRGRRPRAGDRPGVHQAGEPGGAIPNGKTVGWPRTFQPAR